MDQQEIKTSILIVDDTPTNLRLLSEMLTDEGYDVRAVSNGLHAIESIQASLPDLILLDIMMPEPDGFEVCRQLKATKRTRDIPIIFISALDATESKVRAFAEGGVDYITKPFEMQEVLARLRTHMTMKRLNQQLELKNKQLVRQVMHHRQTEQAMINYTNQLKIMHEIDQSILAARSPETIAVAAVGRLRQLVPCQRVFVLELNEDGWFDKLAAEADSEFALEIDTTIYQEIIDRAVLWGGRAYGISDLATIENRSEMQEALYREGIHSYLMIPLRAHDQLLGSLHLEAAQPSAFSAEHVNATTEIATLLTVAIRQAHLYAQAQRDIAERKRAMEALEARNAELDAFAHTVAHDLKNPLMSLMGFSELMEGRTTQLPTKQMEQYVGYIGQSAHKMNSIIEELLLLSSVRGMQDVAITPLDMNTLVRGALLRLGHMLDSTKPEIFLPESWPQVDGHGPWIEEVWANYISNALKYGGTPPQVELGATELDDEVQFWVRDNGDGLTPEQRDQLFTPFERLHQVRAKGHGLGLSIVKRIVEKLGGQVGVESETDQGSTFFFTLPRS